MNLRQYVFDDGTATAFIIVASAFTLAGLSGWRLAAAVIRPTRDSHADSRGR